MQIAAMSMPNRSGDALIAAGASASLRDHWRICSFVLLLFVMAATFSAVRKDVTRGFDEVAHASYVAHLQKTGEVWPAFDDQRALDPVTFRFTGGLNYLNHPSPYYVLLARLGPQLEGHPEAIVVHRLLNIVLVAIGLAAMMMIGLIAPLPRLSLYAYVVPLACIPVLVPLAGAINNDNLAFAGGGIATLAAWQLASTGSRASLLAALAGVVMASWAKMTGLLLVGGLVGGVLVWTLWRGRFQAWWIVPIAIAGMLAVAPYVAFIVQYGSPAPATAGQIAMIKMGAHVGGLDVAPRMSPGHFVVHFVASFVSEWMPVLEPRNALNYMALSIPVAAILVAFAGLVVSLKRMARGDEGAIDIVVAAGALAFTVTFVIHIFFDYRYHVPYGWTSVLPRYYLPLAALVPLAGLSLLAAIKQPRMHAVLIGFLIASPVLFRLLGAPLG
ncbi:MAG: hypothetical protein JWO28_75 [Hyphomicrobiales bacterium]|nr:hypothetical protein [Hyphomicrobiales bacterium]